MRQDTGKFDIERAGGCGVVWSSIHGWISFMSVAELFYGADNSDAAATNLSLIEEFLLSVQVIQSEFSIMKRFGSIKAKLKRLHKLVPDADIFISSTAIEKCEFLVTGNQDHFSRIDALKLENWIR